MRRFLATPTGWFALIFAELIALSGILRWLVRTWPDLSRGAIWTVAIGLMALLAAGNYVVRRRFLSER